MSINLETFAAAKSYTDQAIHLAELNDIQLDKTLSKINFAADSYTVGQELKKKLDFTIQQNLSSTQQENILNAIGAPSIQYVEDLSKQQELINYASTPGSLQWDGVIGDRSYIVLGGQDGFCQYYVHITDEVPIWSEGEQGIVLLNTMNEQRVIEQELCFFSDMNEFAPVMIVEKDLELFGYTIKRGVYFLSFNALTFGLDYSAVYVSNFKIASSFNKANTLKNYSYSKIEPPFEEKGNTLYWDGIVTNSVGTIQLDGGMGVLQYMTDTLPPIELLENLICIMSFELKQLPLSSCSKISEGVYGFPGFFYLVYDSSNSQFPIEGIYFSRLILGNNSIFPLALTIPGFEEFQSQPNRLIKKDYKNLSFVDKEKNWFDYYGNIKIEDNTLFWDGDPFGLPLVGSNFASINSASLYFYVYYVSNFIPSMKDATDIKLSAVELSANGLEEFELTLQDCTVGENYCSIGPCVITNAPNIIIDGICYLRPGIYFIKCVQSEEDMLSGLTYPKSLTITGVDFTANNGPILKQENLPIIEHLLLKGPNNTTYRIYIDENGQFQTEAVTIPDYSYPSALTGRLCSCHGLKQDICDALYKCEECGKYPCVCCDDCGCYPCVCDDYCPECGEPWDGSYCDYCGNGEEEDCCPDCGEYWNGDHCENCGYGEDWEDDGWGDEAPFACPRCSATLRHYYDDMIDYEYLLCPDCGWGEDIYDFQCPVCGEYASWESAEEEMYCENCGWKAWAEDSCPNCGYTDFNENGHCNHCGTSLLCPECGSHWDGWRCDNCSYIDPDLCPECGSDWDGWHCEECGFYVPCPNCGDTEGAWDPSFLACNNCGYKECPSCGADWTDVGGLRGHICDECGYEVEWCESCDMPTYICGDSYEEEEKEVGVCLHCGGRIEKCSDTEYQCESCLEFYTKCPECDKIEVDEAGVCLNCGHGIDPNVCIHCGSDLDMNEDGEYGTCPDCGHYSGMNICPVCSHVLSYVGEDEASMTWNCRHCGWDSELFYATCPECEKEAFYIERENNHCINCGHTFAPDYSTCPQCGEEGLIAELGCCVDCGFVIDENEGDEDGEEGDEVIFRICPSCGEETFKIRDENVGFCTNCNYYSCPNCGRKNLEVTESDIGEVRSCDNCGYDSPVIPKLCPCCGWPMYWDGDYFCDNCGYGTDDNYETCPECGSEFYAIDGARCCSCGYSPNYEE